MRPEFSQRLVLPFAVDFAEERDGRFRVAGWMNTFQVTSSGRLLDYRDFVAWLERSESPSVPMLANHGAGGGANFKTIGLWDEFRFDEQRGMFWGGFVAQGTPLADEARTLIAQRVLRQLSVRVSGTTRVKYVTARDRDLPPKILAAIESSGVEEVALYQNWAPMEGSVVDVADDPAARLLEARTAPPAFDADAVATRVAQQVVDALRAAFDSLRGEMLDQIETLATDPDARYASLLDGADASDGEAEDSDAGAAPEQSSATAVGCDLAALTERIAR